MYSTASNVCGGMRIVQVPSLAIVLLAGFLTSGCPFFLDGFVQYRSKSPSMTHLDCDLWNDARRTALRKFR